MAVPFVLSDTSLSVFIDFTPYTVPSTHANWDKIIEAVADPDTTDADLRSLLDVAKSIAEYMDGAVEYRDRALFLDGRAIDTPLTRRIIKHMNANQPGIAAPLVKFLEKVMNNPSRRAVLGLYDWVERSGLPITPEGDILAYKIVENDFKDCYTKTFDNSPGATVEVRRNEVDENPDQTCSYGLHVCSAKYLPNYGPSDKKVVIVSVNPADFVAVPRDYDVAKARVCKYVVVTEVPPETAATFFPDEYVWSPPEPTFEVGQIWVTAGGQLVRLAVVDEAEDDCENMSGVMLSDGSVRTYYSGGSYLLSGPSDSDLVELAVLWGEVEPEVGQSWIRRDGQTAEITDRLNGLLHTDLADCVWDENGKRYTDSREAPCDLIALIPE